SNVLLGSSQSPAPHRSNGCASERKRNQSEESSSRRRRPGFFEGKMKGYRLHQRRSVFLRRTFDDRKGLFSGGQRLRGGAAQVEPQPGIIAFEIFKNVLNFMRHVTHSVAVQVIAAIITPVVSATAFLPARVAVFADQSQRVEIFHELVLDEQVVR